MLMVVECSEPRGPAWGWTRSAETFHNDYSQWMKTGKFQDLCFWE